jgi:hypothetical protein
MRKNYFTSKGQNFSEIHLFAATFDASQSLIQHRRRIIGTAYPRVDLCEASDCVLLPRNSADLVEAGEAGFHGSVQHPARLAVIGAGLRLLRSRLRICDPSHSVIAGNARCASSLEWSSIRSE